jgi:hypothetical protein
VIFLKVPWFLLAVATAIPCYAIGYRQSRTKVGPTGQLLCTLTRHWNSMKYGGSKLSKEAVLKLSAIWARALEIFASPVLDRKKKLKNTVFKWRQNISPPGARICFGASLHISTNLTGTYTVM